MKNAGVENVTPRARQSTPAIRATGVGETAITTRPTTIMAQGRRAEQQRRQPVGHPGEGDPAHDHGTPVDQQGQTGIAHPDLRGVQRGEGHEPADRGQ